MIKSKKYYADRIIRNLQDGFPNIDFKISEREIFLMLDDEVNSLAKQNYLENWKMFGAGLDESFITTWDGANAISVVDPDGGESPSYMELPAIPSALPNDDGVVEIWPLRYEYGAVRVMKHGDVRKTRRLMSGNLQNELGGFRKGTRFEFNQTDVGKKYGPKFGVRLAVKDSTSIAIDAPYPIASDIEDDVIAAITEKLINRRMMPTDTVRDKQDAVNRN